MLRVYLDTDIISKLKKEENESIWQQLLSSKKHISYCYSEAHLRDKYNDLTDHKFLDFDRISELTNDKLIWLNKELKSLWLEKPHNAFQEVESFESIWNDDMSFSSLFPKEDLEFLTQKERDKFEQLMNQKINLNLLSIKDSTGSELKKGKKQLKTKNKSLTMKDFIDEGIGFFRSIFTDKDAFKAYRRSVIEESKLGSFNIESQDFNDDFIKSGKASSFLNYMKKSTENNKNLTEQSFFISCFLNLNILGLDEEKMKKSVFENTYNDGLHAFYGAHCDIFVTDDNNLRKKANAMFNMLNIGTEVWSLDKLKNQLGGRYFQRTTSIDDFMTKLHHDIKHSIILKSAPALDKLETANIINPICQYFTFFNRLQVSISENNSESFDVFFYRKNWNTYKRQLFNIEAHQLINNIINTLGTDINGEGELPLDEIKTLYQETWKGRTWIVNNLILHLEWHSDLFVTLSLKPEKTHNRVDG